jgi:hypothetical protein
VEKHHCFYANGILVSNCDAAGLMAIVYEEPKIVKRSARKSNWRTA